MSTNKQRAVAYGAVSFSSAAMHNIFITYYIHFFMETFPVSDGWFYVGEILFMIWNAFNDPLFAWWLERSQSNISSSKIRMQQRITIIRYGGLCWAVCFLLIFLPVSSASMWIGFHFVSTLCLYDGMLSLVLLTHGALLADITIDSTERAECNMWNSTFSLAGSVSVLFAQFFWDKNAVASFQVFCLIVAALSALIFLYSSGVLEKKLHSSNYLADQEDTPEEPEKAFLSGPAPLRTLWQQLQRLPNFWVFTSINLIQVFNCHFNSNFLSLSMERLLGLDYSTLSSRQLSALLITASALFPHALVIFFTPFQKTHGLYRLLTGLFIFKLVVAFGVFVFGSFRSWLLIFLFIFINKSFSECICRHGNLVVADLVDEDQVINKRTTSISSMIFGANALFTKPGQSLAPMVGWGVLTYHNFRTLASDDEENESGLNSLMFSMLCLVPMICGALQLFLWRRFTLHGSHLRYIKNTLHKLHSPQSI